MIEQPKIETGIPYLNYQGRRSEKLEVLLRLIRSLKPAERKPEDQSFVWPHNNGADIHKCATRHSLKISVQKVNGGYRIWRIA